MTDDQDAPASKRRSLADIAAIAAVLVTVSAAALYSFGVAYQNANLFTLGFDPRLFPADSYGQAVLGGVVGYTPVYTLFLFVLLGAGLAWGKKAVAKKAPAATSEFWRNPLVTGLSVLIGAWAIWIALQQWNIHSGRRNAANTLQQIRAAPCGPADAVAKVGLALEMEYGEPIRQPGWRMICSERFCGLRDNERAIVVSLEGVKRMQTELPAGCPAALPEKATH